VYFKRDFPDIEVKSHGLSTCMFGLLPVHMGIRRWVVLMISCAPLVPEAQLPAECGDSMKGEHAQAAFSKSRLSEYFLLLPFCPNCASPCLRFSYLPLWHVLYGAIHLCPLSQASSQRALQVVNSEGKYRGVARGAEGLPAGDQCPNERKLVGPRVG
jgi:hypothetical protein